ncbi:hypothetical protein Leryth_025273 [Lithospermum erythrorhizon]|nr:hypothetical protein Leryth_025273 [Lithospermum erythrorhizon]
MELTENLSLVDELNSQIIDRKESEAQALEEIRKAQMQLQVAKITEETMQSEIFEASEAYKSLAFELKKAQNRMSMLEEIVAELQAVRGNTDQALLGSSNNLKQESGDHRESDQHKAEPINLQLEAEQLRTELELAERRFQEENIQGILQTRSAYEVVERIKAETCERKADCEAKLEIARADASKFKNGMMEKELQLQNISEENKGLSQMFEESQSTERVLIIELEKSKSFLTELMASLLDKETKLNGIKEENDMLKLELERREIEGSKLNGEAVVVTEAVSAFDQEALVKLGHVTDETDKSITKAANVTELLDVSQTTNSELEAELRRLKVQADQWRKAAEAAT